ncbi:peptidoglycan-binding protein [Stakelama sp. CBK3Z-3]|uniref:Peptidoglycan-binding protein n=1 Tax=Stakelama flava TaxID=2860338 RepID=A0ABS6XKI3_9SPHN|nr:peptidoglycan-binding protein [Stakelama flava]MBW4330439.1 peptidoglycan-binding protein [Stakelama flava]
MIESLDANRLSPAKRAELIHRTAMADVQQRLWQAALGHGDDFSSQYDSPRPAAGGMDFASMVALVSANRPGSDVRPQPRAAVMTQPVAAVAQTGSLNLGANADRAGTLEAAAQRTGVPETALAAIVDAEAAKDSSGRWNTYSRNPRSSAAGLGQFLSGTWQDMARQPGTWLNKTAAARGWLDASGNIRSAARSDLLRLRYDPDASIQTIADYASRNLDLLERKGVTVGSDATSVARTAYIAHHLGPGDAIRFLTTGLSDERAATLLAAQIGSSKARQAIAAAGDASVAHRAWLRGYVANSVQPQRYA